MNDKILRDEIINDPLGAGYKNKAGGWREDGEIASALNAEVFPTPIKVPVSRLFEYVFRRGVLLVLDDLSKEESDDKRAVRDAARLFMALLYNPHMVEVLVTLPVLVQAVDVLVGAEVFTPSHKTDILNMGTAMMSRSQVLGLGRVDYFDVGRVRSNLDVR